MSSALSVRAKEEDLIRIEAIANECSLSNLGTAGHFMRAFKMAAGIRAMRSAITNEMMQDLLELQGSKLGFRTDKDRERGYSADVVKDCAIEAALRGAYWVGNEFNIIAGSCYLTKEYFIRILREFPGLTDLRLSFAAPVMRPEPDKKAWVACSASWKLRGVADFIEKRTHKIEGTEQMLDERIVVKLNAGMGEDAVLGKAERKLRAAIYSRITGTAVLDGEADDVANSAKKPKNLDDLTMRLEGKTDGASRPIDESSQEVEDYDYDAPYANIQSIGVVNDKEAEIDALDDPTIDRQKNKEAAERRREAIRASRGERSNAK